MGLGANVLANWNVLKNLFPEMYEEYWRRYDMKGDGIFNMAQKEDKTLEDYVSRFMFNLNRNTQHQLNEESQKYIFLKGFNDESTIE